MHEEEHCRADCRGCGKCQEKKARKMVNISDAFLSKAIYTKKPTYYTNKYMDLLGAAETRHASPPSFPETLPFGSAAGFPRMRVKPPGSEFGGGRYSSEGFSKLNSPRKIPVPSDLPFRGPGVLQESPGKEKSAFPGSMKRPSASAGTSFSFNGSGGAGEPWETVKRLGASYAHLPHINRMGSAIDNSPKANTHLSASGIDSGYGAMFKNSPDSTLMSSPIMNLSTPHGLSFFNSELQTVDSRLNVTSPYASKSYQTKSSPGLLSQEIGGGVGGAVFSPIEAHGHSNVHSFSSSGISNTSAIEGEGFYGALPNIQAFSESSFGGRRAEGASSSMYNPLLSSMYDVSQMSQLRHTSILSSAVMPLIDGSIDSARQHSRLNEVLGLPKIQPHHVMLTKNILSIVISNGGLQVVDEKNLWGMVAKEIGQKTDDIMRLRMYYIIVCYPYEQIRLVRALADGVVRTLVIVYIDPKKADILPDIISQLGQKKKTEGKTQKTVKVVETSGILEVVVALNEMYVNGVKSSHELKESLRKFKGLSCESEEARDVLSCQEMALIEMQMRAIMAEWVSRKIEEVSLKEKGVDKEVIENYEDMLCEILKRAEKREIAQKAPETKDSKVECSSSEKTESSEIEKESDYVEVKREEREERTEKPLEKVLEEKSHEKSLSSDAYLPNAEEESMKETESGCTRMCARKYRDYKRLLYLYPCIELKDRADVSVRKCTQHSMCRIYQNNFCPCGKTAIKFDTVAEEYYSALVFLAKSTALHVSSSTVSLLARILEHLPEEALSFRHRYIYKGLISLWNILKEKEAQDSSFVVNKKQANECFSKITKEVRKLLSSCILSRQDILSVLSNGQLEVIFKIANTKDGSVILEEVSPKRLAEIWRYLLLLVCKGFFSGPLETLQETALICLDKLSMYLHKYFIKNKISSDVLGVMELKEGDWIEDVLSFDMFAESVYSFCDFLFSPQIPL
ncbi:hypothetical protein NEMIN01_1817 [Nematocida minor]|uniref:uncharacterized protein n=1 Tax=Nematocida minor TaxID=1912983 RepID=UPI00221FF360|nr:uncharacterized protein NEMIN01_1817 [Nematocida minor]KAI5192121.1 hypothetical protein NEMIN01_1817 [Nematocida minor]